MGLRILLNLPLERALLKCSGQCISLITSLYAPASCLTDTAEAACFLGCSLSDASTSKHCHQANVTATDQFHSDTTQGSLSSECQLHFPNPHVYLSTLYTFQNPCYFLASECSKNVKLWYIWSVYTVFRETLVQSIFLILFAVGNRGNLPSHETQRCLAKPGAVSDMNFCVP